MINRNQMMNQLKKLQKEAEEAQAKLQSTTFLGTSGGGAVCVKVNGAKDVLGVTIDKEMISGPEDIDFLQDALVAAFRDAYKKVDEETQKVLGPAASGMGLF